MKNNKTLKIVLIVSAIVVFIAAILIVINILDREHGIFSDGENNNQVLEHDGQKYVLKDGVETFLVMGLDKMGSEVTNDSYNNNQQADFLMLMVFDNKAKTYSTIHINRDTMVEIEKLGIAGEKTGTVNTQIALAHTYGKGGTISNSNTARAVSKYLYNVKVNHYMSLTLDSVPVMNELVGGISLEVLEDFTKVEGGENLIKGETVKLTPEEALLYVQGRKGLEGSSNEMRMERQQQYLNAMRVEVEKKIENDKEFLANAVIKMADYMDSDCSTARLQEMGKRMQEYEYVEIADIKGESKIGAENKMEFYPDEEALKKLVIDLFYVPKK